MTYQELAQQSLDVQDASNLSGVVKAFARGMDVLWDEAHKRSEGTNWVNKHPIVTLFIDKLKSLNGEEDTLIYHAYDKVREIATNVEATAHT